MSGSNRSDGGYGRPPVDHQFKPGQSGNPRGRPKGRKNFETMFLDVLNRKITVRDKNGARVLSKIEAILEVQLNKALAGDSNAFAKVFQIAEKFEAFKWQPQEINHPALVQSAMEKLDRLIARQANARDEEP
jgi:Family of unknown function (DUF5681)